MKKLVFVLFCLLSFWSTATEVQTTSIYFETAQYEASEQETLALQKFLEQLPLSGDFEFILEGHTDSRGSIEYNDRLSLQRAQFIENYLLNAGVAPDKIVLHHFGERNPIATQPDELAMANNRRVSVEFRHYFFNDIKELEAAFLPKYNNAFTVDATQQNVVQGKQGMQVLIPANALLDSAGNPIEEPVTIELIEAPALEGFIASNLTTQSSGKLLESGGMLKIDASTASGQEVHFNPEQAMIVSVPSNGRQEGMELFLSPEGQDWDATTVSLAATSSSGNTISVPAVTWTMENRPKFLSPGYHMPSYVADYSGRPEPPIRPFKPLAPHAPRSEAYEAHFAWYQVFGREKVRQQKQEWYNKALDQYAYRQERYVAQDEVFQRDNSIYQQKVIEHDSLMSEWHSKLDCDRIEFFLSDDYQEALDVHNRRWKEASETYETAVQEWRDRQVVRAKQVAQNMDSMGIATKKAMDNYVFALNTFGWINVDRWYHLSEVKKVQLVVLDNDTIEERATLVFSDIRSMIPMYRYKGSYIVDQYPTSEAATILAYKVIDGKAWVATHKIDGEFNIELDYKQSTFAELREIIEELQSTQEAAIAQL